MLQDKWIFVPFLHAKPPRTRLGKALVFLPLKPILGPPHNRHTQLTHRPFRSDLLPPLVTPREIWSGKKDPIFLPRGGGLTFSRTEGGEFVEEPSSARNPPSPPRFSAEYTHDTNLFTTGPTKLGFNILHSLGSVDEQQYRATARLNSSTLEGCHDIVRVSIPALTSCIY